MKVWNARISHSLAVLLLVGIIALPAMAQEATDYPPQVEGEVLDSDSVVVEDGGEQADVGQVEVTETAEVQGVALARTGGDVLVILIAGVLIAGLGMIVLFAGRRSRSASHSL